MKLLPTLGICFFLMSSPNAKGKDVLGSGTASCGTWLEAKSEPANRQVYGQWVLGFISGSNWRSELQARPVDTEAALAFVDVYCTNNPTHMLVMAASAAVEVTGGPKTVHKWKR